MLLIAGAEHEALRSRRPVHDVGAARARQEAGPVEGFPVRVPRRHGVRGGDAPDRPGQGSYAALRTRLRGVGRICGVQGSSQGAAGDDAHGVPGGQARGYLRAVQRPVRVAHAAGELHRHQVRRVRSAQVGGAQRRGRRSVVLEDDSVRPRSGRDRRGGGQPRGPRHGPHAGGRPPAS